MVKQFSLRFTLVLAFSDLILVFVALLLAAEIRELLPVGKSSDPSTWQLPLPIYFIVALIWGIIFTSTDVYNPREVLHLHREIVKLIEGTAVAGLIFSGVLYFTYRQVSRLEIVYFLAIYQFLIITYRVAVRFLFKITGTHRYDARRVLIVGTGQIAREIGCTVKENAWMGLELVGYAAEDEEQMADCDLPVLGLFSETPALIEANGISEVVIALPWQIQQLTRNFVRELQTLPVNIRIIPDYFELVFLRLSVEDFSGLPLLTLKEPVLDPFQRLIKRAFDIVVTAMLMIPALPLMALIAIMIRLDSPGPILFKQKRVGERNRIFCMYKFRSMRDGAEHMQPLVNTTDVDGNVIHKHPDDPRVTRVGYWLRRLSLDELPQLFNILRGEMSLVGPRPEMPWLVDQYEAWQRKRFEVPQGLTGWWQINGRSERLMHLNTEDDLFYIRNYSLWLDIKILWRTLQTVLIGRGAY